MYTLYNVRGDVVQLTNASGNVTATYRYTAFGNELNPDTNNNNRFRFSGEYWDAHRGEIYLRARSFNPRTGRFTQPAPWWDLNNMIHGSNPIERNGRLMPNTHAILQSGNLFMFVMHDPVNFIDPTGLWGVRVHLNHTQVWARDADFTRSQAILISDANFGVDLFGQSAFWHWDKDTSWHVNTFETGDSRLEHAERMLASALYQWNAADIAFDNAMASVSSSSRFERWIVTSQAETERNRQRNQSLATLGQGLHPLQDYFAYGSSVIDRSIWIIE